MKRRSFETPLEHQRLMRLAREYERAGYTVVRYPQPDELPESLRRFAIALIAHNLEETIVADVRSRPNLTLNGSADLHRIAETIQQLPGWRFNLVVTNPRNSQTCSQAS